MKDVIFKSTLNTRSILENDIRYIRSDVPINISENEKDKLLWNNITTIIDLRTETERKKKQCPLIDDSRFSYFFIRKRYAKMDTDAREKIAFCTAIDALGLWVTSWKEYKIFSYVHLPHTMLIFL